MNDVDFGDSITRFKGQYSFLSNFYPASLVWEGLLYPTSEHAYQASKTVNLQERMAILQLERPGYAKRAGKRVTMRPDWDSIKIDVMRQIVRQKFTQNPHLLAKLLATGDSWLEEGNDHGDRFWGVCPPETTNGRNELGKILMELRAEFQNEQDIHRNR